MTSQVLFRFDHLSNFVGIFIGFFFLLTIIYSLGFMRQRKGLVRYYAYMTLTLASSLGAVFANNLLLFIVFWGFLGPLLYLLINFGEKENTPVTAKKAFIIIGASDALMLFGLAIIWQISGTLRMDAISITLHSQAAVWAYLCFAAGALAKAGAMPLHTWVPDTAEDAPVPVTAYLPASLDKLLGIYFLSRISLDLFQMDAAMNTFLQAVGSITIIAAVMMALVQHDLKRLLGYHAVSQVGYMVLGIGTANPLGIAGGLFHMLNHAIYKSCLFFSAGSVEKRAGTTDLERLGGYARIMPLTFGTFLIASLSISGVPPFNGFVSKWMVYQGIIAAGRSAGGYLWVIWLLAALLGSALTLASFMKLLQAVFLGQPHTASAQSRPKGEAFMRVPCLILAVLCVLFGVFAYKIPLALFIVPCVGKEPVFSGSWEGSLATLLLLAGGLLGIVIYVLGNISSSSKRSAAFVGGELLEEYPAMRVSGVDFYNTIRELGGLRRIYRLAEQRAFDIYEQLKNVCLGASRILRIAHTGVLTTYVSWILIGMLILLFLVR